MSREASRETNSGTDSKTAKIPYTADDVDYLLSPQAIRERAALLYQHALDGRTQFRVHLEKLDEVSEYVTQVTLANYPKLQIPFHSRWGHFQVGGVDRISELNKRLAELSPEARVRAKLDLVIVSVLLDAGSGPGWKYEEAMSQKSFSRSEGLGVASFRMFMQGAFSSDPKHPLRADGRKLASLELSELAKGFQVTDVNPLAGLDGRLRLLRSLGEAVEKNSIHFPANTVKDVPRPGLISDSCRSLVQASAQDNVSLSLSAPQLLLAVLQGLGPIWPGRIQLGTTPLGDVWAHELLGKKGTVASLIPFHKLSQWMTYSLIEPIEEAGLKISDVEGLTGLAEYRNGGLLLDRGLIELRDPALLVVEHRPESELIIEWRALTIVLLAKIADGVRKRLGKTEAELPLAKVLEGGTWWAGRKAAAALRPEGGPPLKIISDGTVF